MCVHSEGSSSSEESSESDDHILENTVRNDMKVTSKGNLW